LKSICEETGLRICDDEGLCKSSKFLKA